MDLLNLDRKARKKKLLIISKQKQDFIVVIKKFCGLSSRNLKLNLLDRQLFLRQNHRNMGVLLGQRTDLLSEMDEELLSCPFTEQEVQEALMQMNSHSAADPDGLHVQWYIKFNYTVFSQGL